MPASSATTDAPPRSPTRSFAVGLARATGGAVIFALPILMTQEMWQLGFTMAPARLALLVALSLPLLVGLSHFSGFEETFDVVEDAVDACVAWAVAVVTSAAVLALFDVLRPGLPLAEAVGKVALQAVPASVGALLAQSQFGQQGRGGGDGGERRDNGPSGYFGQLFLMVVGALFLAFNIAPTEEVALLAYQMTPWHVLALAAVTLAAMHAFVYALEFRGQEAVAPGTPGWSVFLRFTVVGYALALAVSAYVLWTFGRLDGTGASAAVSTVLVLGFPAAIGAAAARLIL